MRIGTARRYGRSGRGGAGLKTGPAELAEGVRERSVFGAPNAAVASSATTSSPQTRASRRPRRRAGCGLPTGRTAVTVATFGADKARR